MHSCLRAVSFTLLFISLISGHVFAANSVGDQVLGNFLDDLKKAQSSYNSITGYEALFVKSEDFTKRPARRERIRIYFDKPFRVFMKWLNTDKQGLQVAYARGRHDNKLGIHKPGLFLGLAPIVFLPQDSPWVREGSQSYNIEDVGLGTFLDSFQRSVDASLHTQSLDVKKIGAGHGYRVTFTGSVDDENYFAYRIDVFFDQKRGLPTAFYLYDWRQQIQGSYVYLYASPTGDWLLSTQKPKEMHTRIHRDFYK